MTNRACSSASVKTSDYVKWTVAMLRGELSRRGLSKVGKKNDMIRTLIDDDEKQLLDDGDEKSKKVWRWGKAEGGGGVIFSKRSVFEAAAMNYKS